MMEITLVVEVVDPISIDEHAIGIIHEPFWRAEMDLRT
jgi:hypothetical protein